MPRPAVECGNPLWRDWVQEWADELRHTKAYFTYIKAYNSLARCTQSFTHPSEAIQLHGIGSTIVGRLERRLVQYCQENDLPMPTRPSRAKRKVLNDDNIVFDDDGSQPRKRRVPRAYVPRYRTGPYAILLTLLEYRENNNQLHATRDQIVRVAESYCDSSFDMSEAGNHYTAWNSIKTLMNKDYVWKHGSPARYTLTDTGLAMAKQLKEVSDNGGPPARASSSTQGGNRLQENDDSDSGGDEVDLSLYVRNPESYRASMANGSSQSRQRNTDNNEEQVDLSLYVRDPESYRASMTNGSSQSRQRNPEPEDDEVDLSLYVRNPESYRASMNNGGSQSRRRDPEPEEDEVDLSLYVRNPESYRASMTNGISQTNSLSRASSPPRNNRSLNASGPSRANNVPRASSLSRSVPRDTTFEQEVDLSLYVTDPARFRASRPSSSSQLPPRNKSEDIDLSLYETDPDSYLTSLCNNAIQSRNSHSTPQIMSDDEEPVDLSFYVTDPPSFRSQVATSTANNSTQISLLDDDDDDDPPHASINNDVFSRYQSPVLPATTLSNRNFNSFDDDGIIELDSPSPPRTPPRPSQPFLSSLPDPDDISLPDSELGSQAILQYTFVDTDNKAVRHISQAAVKLYDGEAMYKIRFSSNQYAHPRTDRMRDTEPDVDNTFSGYIAENDCDVVCPGLPLAPLTPLNSEQEDDFWPVSNIPESASSTPLNSQVTDSQVTAMEEFEEYPPDSYEVVLVLDTREIKLRTNRDFFLEQLTAKGIRVIKRALDLGDMLWVAQKKGSKSSTDELFLDFIVERKRMDDLVSSIKDGRFDEQKHRLRNCGAEKVIYIVEEFNKDDALQFGAQAIQTAMSSTQTVDGFYLKRTANINDTIEYLVNMTKMVEQIYHNATLYRIPEHTVTRTGYLRQKKRLGKNYLVSYPIYSELNSKNDTLTVKDVYLRMLMTIRGVSADKASALAKIYPTPYQLLRSYASKTEEEGKALAKDATKDGIYRRRWGQQLSERLWEVWGNIEV